jgi:glycosyltransferase involved in cell wall biosynthesis
MNILIININDKIGGAGIASYRLFEALRSIGVNCRMLVMNKSSNEDEVIPLHNRYFQSFNILRSRLDKIEIIRYRSYDNSIFSPSIIKSPNLISKINELRPDLIHLHWIAGGMLKLEELKDIKIPIVWSLHDMWPFTGGCHYDNGCGRFINSCGKCPILGSDIENDLSRKVHKRKIDNYPNVVLIGLSKWIQNSAKSSSIFKKNKIVNLPNTINTGRFKRKKPEFFPKIMEFSKYKKIILFGAMDSTSDKRKGFKELVESIKLLDKEKYQFVVFGSNDKIIDEDIDMVTIGKVHDEQLLIELYSLSDVMIVPSLQENLSNVIMESMSCGTPVVAFDIGGNSDMIQHKKNGYLAKPFNHFDLAIGVETVIDNKDIYSKNAIEFIKNQFDYGVVAQKYRTLYQKMLDVSTK